MKKIMTIFGTRPEAIKMCPVIIELKQSKKFKTIITLTGQHREMLDDVLKAFKIVPDYNLNIMKSEQSLFDITINILKKINQVLDEVTPDLVLVHGDTSTTFLSSLACFYKHIPIGHIEAGLRTYNINSPFPEEFNRRAVSIISKYDFAPTKEAMMNLIKEGKDKKNIYITGNTAIDSLKFTVRDDFNHPLLTWAKGSKLIILTAHRRENLEKLENIFLGIKNAVDLYPDLKVIYPVHKNPKVESIAKKVFNDYQRIKLIPPLNVIEFHNFLARSYLILTDSGGIQEEAPSLNVPVLVLREETERPEGILSNALKLVGTNKDNIYQEIKALIENKEAYQKMKKATNPFGDGLASTRIKKILEDRL